MGSRLFGLESACRGVTLSSIGPCHGFAVVGYWCTLFRRARTTGSWCVRDQRVLAVATVVGLADAETKFLEFIGHHFPCVSWRRQPRHYCGPRPPPASLGPQLSTWWPSVQLVLWRCLFWSCTPRHAAEVDEWWYSLDAVAPSRGRGLSLGPRPSGSEPAFGFPALAFLGPCHGCTRAEA